MAKYEVLTKSYINNSLVDAGTIVQINDDPKKGGMKPGVNLKKVGKEAPEQNSPAPAPAQSSDGAAAT